MGSSKLTIILYIYTIALIWATCSVFVIKLVDKNCQISLNDKKTTKNNIWIDTLSLFIFSGGVLYFQFKDNRENVHHCRIYVILSVCINLTLFMVLTHVCNISTHTHILTHINHP